MLGSGLAAAGLTRTLPTVESDNARLVWRLQLGDPVNDSLISARRAVDVNRSDDCRYYYDGVQYTGEVDCGDASSEGGEEFPAGWYPSVDGSSYYRNGTQDTGVKDRSNG